MAWQNLITTSLFGRRFGLQNLTTAQSGGRLPAEFLVGAEQTRMGVTTTESTATNLLAHGVSNLTGTSAASSAVYTLDPPIPGVMKYINFGTTANGPIYVKTSGGETFNSSQGTTFSVLKSTGNVAGTVPLIGITTAIWGFLPGMSTASFALSTTT